MNFFYNLGPDQPALKSKEQSADLGSYCFHYRLSKILIIRKREKTNKSCGWWEKG